MGSLKPSYIGTNFSWSQGALKHWDQFTKAPMFQFPLGPTSLGFKFPWYTFTHVPIYLLHVGTNSYRSIWTKSAWNQFILVFMYQCSNWPVNQVTKQSISLGFKSYWFPVLLEPSELGLHMTWYPFLLVSRSLGFKITWFPVPLVSRSLGFDMAWNQSRLVSSFRLINFAWSCR